jgi:hypothetical protein
MKRLIFTLTALTIILGLAWLVPHSTFEMQVQTPTPAANTAVLPAPTESPTSSVPLTAIPGADGVSVSAAGVTFNLPLGLASGAQVEVVPVTSPEETMQVWPQYLKFTLQGYNLPNTLYAPQILVFPVAEYQRMSNNPVASQYDAQTMVANLQEILTTRQIAGWKAVIPMEGMNQGNYLPVLPDQHAAQVFHTQEKLLTFQGGSGLRYVTAFSQAHYPAVGPELLYAFQGLTSDGKYYISVLLPLQQPNLAPMPTTAENDANYPAYISSTVATLSQPEGEGVNPFAPSLAALDRLAQSITVTDATATAPATDWLTYHNAVYGFSFEYPAIYESTAFQASCGLKENADSLQIGHQIMLQTLDSGGLSLADFANQFLAAKGWSMDTQANTTVNGAEAIAFQYRFGGTNRFGSLTFISHAGKIVVLNFTAGGFCEVPQAEFSEPSAYTHLVQTFRFDQAGAACPMPVTGTKLLTNDTDGYCLLYPETASVNAQHLIVLNPNNNPGDVPGDAWVLIQVEPATGRTAAQVAEAQITAVGQGFNITSFPIQVNGDEAVVVDGLPGQDSNRQLFVVHGDRLYTFSFAPWYPTAPTTGQATPLEALYTMLTQSLHFLP